MTYGLTDKAVNVFIVELYAGVSHRVRINVLYLHAHLTACKLLAEDGCLLEGIDGAVWIDATLEAITGIGAQTVTACTLANPCGMEVGALQHHVCGGVVRAATLAAENSGNAHRLLCIADAEVVLAESVLLTVKSDKLGAFRLGADHNLVASHHVSVEAMHRLTVSHHHVVGDVHDVVDRTQTDDLQLVLKPLGALLHLTTRDRHAGIALASLRILNLHVNGEVVIVYCKFRAVRTMQRCLMTVALEPSIEVACHTPV